MQDRVSFGVRNGRWRLSGELGTAGRFVEIHHIVHWLHGGTTDTWNLISLCPRHHKLHHQGGLGISGNADRFDQIVFTDARGDTIAHTGTPTPSDSLPPATSSERRGAVRRVARGQT